MIDVHTTWCGHSVIAMRVFGLGRSRGGGGGGATGASCTPPHGRSCSTTAAEAGGAGGASETCASAESSESMIAALSVSERRKLSIESMRERPEVLGDLGLDLGWPVDEFVVVVPEGTLGADCARRRRLASGSRFGGDGSRGSEPDSGAWCCCGAGSVVLGVFSSFSCSVSACSAADSLLLMWRVYNLSIVRQSMLQCGAHGENSGR
mmetsp:Transcript_10611/g.22300  ORF Transcript_10611/g.22300 Transcript_10611/m.22300 type:complete len:207 (+) Transcript_10611:215-835(+)